MAVTVTVATYTAGMVLGRATVDDAHTPAADHGSATAATPTSTAPTATAPTSTAPAGTDRRPEQEPLGRPEPPPGETALDLAAVLDDVPQQQPAAPGSLPLAVGGSGPFGTHRTTGSGYAALTFDDGPDPRWTPQVLELLRTHDVQATFCVVGSLAERHPGLVRDIAAAGHTLCNHTWDHDIGLGSRSREAIRADLRRTSDAIRTAAPEAPISYYRQPGGAWTARVVSVATELGMSSLHWDVDPADWREPGAGTIARTVRRSGENAIVLLHDGGGDRSDTVAALRRVLPALSRTLSLDALPPAAPTQPPRHGLGLPVRPAQI